MSLATLDDILDDLFLWCALVAFQAIAEATGHMSNPLSTRQIVNHLCEVALPDWVSSLRSEPVA